MEDLDIFFHLKLKYHFQVYIFFLFIHYTFVAASKAVDVLLDSEWATGKDALFSDRQSVVDYCNR